MTNKTANKILAISLITLITIFFFSYADAQTVQELDQRLKRVEDSLGINSVIVPIDTATTLPVYQGIILNGSYDIFPVPYSPMFQDRDNLYKLFVLKGGQPYAVGSSNGMNNWIYSSTGNMPYGTVIKENPNRYLAAYHKWYNNQAFYYFAGSTNSYNWNDMALIRQPHGEDITFIIDGGKYKAYARMSVPPAIRTIGYMESQDFRNWTTLVEVLKPDALDGLNQFYSMSVVKGNYGYFGFLNVFNTGTDLVSVQLVWSENGEDNNWQRLNGRQEILTKKNGVQCLYGIASVIGDEVYITTISSKFNHSENNRNGQYYYTELYKISLTELQKYVQ
jgi:hypothetical protein